MNRPPLHDWLSELGACKESLEWIGDRNNLEAAWNAVPPKITMKLTAELITKETRKQWTMEGEEWLDWLEEICCPRNDRICPKTCASLDICGKSGEFPYSSLRDGVPPHVMDAWDAYCWRRWMEKQA